MKYLDTTATLSDCGLYRYTLSRLWNPDRETVVFLMLNPSTAEAGHYDGDKFIGDDPTIKRCVKFADAWGYGRLVVVNLFALRATDPRALAKASDPVGPENDAMLYREASGRIVVCAWGAIASSFRRPTLRNRPAAVRAMLAGQHHHRLRHLGLTQDGHPKHPLARGKHRVPDDAVPLTFPEANQ